MKENRNSELGRSMIEMVGVLIVIAILTIASLGGFSFVMKTWRQRQTIDQVNAIALGMRAGNVASRYAAGEAVPIKTVVRGLKPKTDSAMDGAVALPDGPDSYVKVTSFGANQYMLEMDVEPGTCEEFLDNLMDSSQSARGLNPDIVKICNGTIDSHGNCSTETGSDDKYCEGGSCTLTDVIAELKTNEQNKADGKDADDVTKASVVTSICTNRPKTALIWGCEGASVYFYNGQCAQCPKSRPFYDGTRCCEALDSKTGLCPHVCPAGSYWWSEGGKCVECFENDHCPNTIFSEHICDMSTHTCVECLENRHCTEASENLADRTADPSPRDNDWRKMLCSVGMRKCYECLKDDECPSNTVEIEDGKTVTWDGVCLKDRYTCSPCIKDYQGKGTTERGECPAAAPVCHNPGTVNATCGKCDICEVWDSKQGKCVLPEGTLVENGHCVKCILWNYKGIEHEPNAGCPGKGDGDMKDVCIKRPNGTDDYDRICVVCAEDYDESDPGNRARCGNNSQPDLDWKDGLFCSNRENYEAGRVDEEDYTCHKCINDKEDDAERDTGCDDSAHPELIRCDAAYGKFGERCLAKEARTCKGYYYKPDGKVYKKIDEAKDECQTLFGVECAEYTGWTFVEIGENPDACYADPCGGKYYDHTGKELTAEEAQRVGATLDTCPLSSADGSAWPKQCVCDLRCTDGYYKKDSANKYSSLTDAECARVEGGKCSPDACESVPAGTIKGKQYACVCNNLEPPSCDEVGYYNKIKTGSTFTYQKLADGKTCQNPVRETITIGKKTIEHACICTACTGCLLTDGTCMKAETMQKYDDLYKDNSGYCTCYGIVRTPARGVDNFASNHEISVNYPQSGGDPDKNCSRKQSYRQLRYSVDVNFYCPRYMHISDKMEADDFVYKSSPAGIGTTSPAVKDKTWEKAHTNTITPKVSNKTVQGEHKDTSKGYNALYLIVQDRWLGGVGLSTGGFFYFTDAYYAGAQSEKAKKVRHVAKKAHAKPNSQKAAVAALGSMKTTLPEIKVRWATKSSGGSWNSSQTSPLGNLVCKKGEKSTTRKDCSKYCNNWTGPY